MNRKCAASQIHLKLIATTLLLCLALLDAHQVRAQGGDPCDTPTPTLTGGSCPPGIPLPPGTFSAVPLIDGAQQSYAGGNVVSLYGAYGNDEQHSPNQTAKDHYAKGTNLATQVDPLNSDGNPDPTSGKIVFLFLGFSNCDIEICGGDADIWDGQDPHQSHLAGQPCANLCENLYNPHGAPPWNQVAGDGITQKSFLYQVYPPTGSSLVGPHVVVFNGALGGQTLDRWDTTAFFASHPCPMLLAME